MNGDVGVRIFIWIAGLVFGAGVAWAGLRQNKRDINSVGGKQRRFEKNLVLALLVIADKREDRIYLAQFLKDP